jgi:DNA repair protein RadD
LAVSPTGSGKTLIISWLLKKLGGRQVILQHREELVEQNRQKFHAINPYRTSSVYGLGVKDVSGETIFGMAQTLGRAEEINKIPPLDYLVIDEAHHVRAESYLRIVEGVRSKNPSCRIAGFTATAARGDKRGLKPVFDNVCAVISIRQLIDLGFLVPVRTFIASLPDLAGKIEQIQKTSSGEFDMEEVDLLMNTHPINESVFREWHKVAGDRKTIVFCSTVGHAESVCEYFCDQGIKAESVFDHTNQRSDILNRYDRGDTQVLCNVSVLTESYDSPPTSCIVVLRPSSFKSTILQMIGRGLRVIDPELYPGVIKRDCLVLDFGETLANLKDLELQPRLDDPPPGDFSEKVCPHCSTVIPLQVLLCPVVVMISDFQDQKRMTTKHPMSF